ncbi:MAG: polysaccharide biosynthesis protein, partial [Verrucomicrobiae bacterium]|nr:polysaccharide biosynthesis protein [Verrucomicrobiae bacterium]
FHAAAHKQVPMMENQPAEAIRNNVFATADLADLARETCVERFVLISTDKAINPSSVMGATKRLAELFLQSLAAAHPTPTKFISVRFGNVLGSSGSVIPIFTQQIASGGPVTVTHPQAARYFMTLSEAVGLVLQSAALGQGGETFALDMGRPIKILDLARQMIELSGFKPEEDIKIEFVGLRPGEKLFEEVCYTSECYAPTAHPKIKRFSSDPLPIDDIRNALDHLRNAIDSSDVNQLKLLLKRYVPEYQPFLG